MNTSIVEGTGFYRKLVNLWSRKTEYKFWVYRFKWNYYPSLRLLNSAPLHVDIEVTDACNLKCIMCIHGTEEIVDTGFIDKELAFRAIEQCAEIGVYSIKFNFRGEPLLHPDIVTLVRYAKAKGILEVQFNTNGLPLTKQKIKGLLGAGLDRIIFSVDGATKETYEKIRVGGNYDKLVSNIDMLLKMKKELKFTRPYVRVQMVKYYDSDEEVEQFKKLWTKKNVNNIAIIKKQDRDSKNGYPLKDGEKPIGRTFCEQPWQRLNINRDGKILMCCGDWDRKTIVGDFKKQTIKEVWKSEKLKVLRAKLAKGQLDEVPACRTCFRPTTYRWS